MNDTDSRLASMTLEEKRALLATLLQRREVVEPARSFPLSHGQRALWLLSMLDPESPAFHVVCPIRIRSVVDPRALREALQLVHERHAVLNAGLEIRDGDPVLVPGRFREVDFRVVDVAGDSDESLLARATDECRAPFDYTRGPFFRAALFTRAPDDHAFVFTVHHLIADGHAMTVLVDDIFAAYEALSRGVHPALPPLQSQYVDFVRWQERYLDSPAAAADRDFWTRQCAGELPVIDLPRERPVPPTRTLRGGSVRVGLDAELSREVSAFGAVSHATTFAVLLAAYKVLLYRHTGTADVIVGTPFAGRSRPEFARMVGMCVNPLPLRTALDGNPSFRTVVERVRHTVADALDHQDFPFPLLVRALGRDNGSSRSPVFQAVFNLFRMPRNVPAMALTAPHLDQGRFRLGGLDVQALGIPQQEGQFELALELFPVEDRIVGMLRYNTDLVPRRFAEQLAERYPVLLESVLRHPDQPIGEVTVVREDARPIRVAPRAHASVPAFWDRQDTSLAAAFHDIARRQPGAIAVRSRGRSWTYAALERMVGAVARVIGTAAPENRTVGLALPTDVRAIASVLGTLAMGCAYVPLDPTWPDERLAFIARDARVGLVLHDPQRTGLANVMRTNGIPTIPLPELDSRLEPEADMGRGSRSTGGGSSSAAVSPRAAIADGGAGDGGTGRYGASPDDVAYILYTSGSTGRPKGVVQSHRNVLRHIANYSRALGITPSDRLTLLTSFGFDAAVMDLFGALLNGATLCIYDLADEPLHGLPQWIADERITVYHSTPTLFRALAAQGFPAGMDAVRYVVLGGEEAVRRDAEIVREAFPADCVLVNGYGPSECTVAAQCFIDRSVELVGTRLPIGTPVDGIELLLLEEDGRPTPVYGEIGIRGSHIALGYHGMTELTARSFLPDPDGGDRGIYRSGDLGRRRPDGLFEFVGRREGLVKIRGFRIELAEIEATLVAESGVQAAAVLPAGDDDAAATGPAEDRLVAFVVPTPGTTLDAHALRQSLARTLPAYMIPARFVMLAAIPRTANGKVDRKVLRTLDPGPATTAPADDGPANPTEELVAEIWRELLGLDAIGMNDNFYDLGGHSMLAMRAVARIEKATGVRINPRELNFQTARQLAATCIERTASPPAQSTRVGRRVTNRLLRALGVASRG